MSGFFDALTHAAEKVDALVEDVLSQTESVISGEYALSILIKRLKASFKAS